MRVVPHLCASAIPLLVLLGCGEPSGPATTAPEPSTGAEAREPVAAEPEPEPEPEEEQTPEPPPTGPAQVTLTAEVHGQKVAATVRLLGEDGSVAAEGPGGQPLRVDSGQYDMEIQVTDAKALIDTPTLRRTLELSPGDDVQESVEFPWARVQLNVRVNGSPDPRAVVRVMRGGEVVAEIKSGAEHVGISPGRYQAKVKTRGAEIDVAELMFPAGATQGVPVNVQM